MKRRILALVLSMVMLMMAMPTPVFSEENANDGGVVVTQPEAPQPQPEAPQTQPDPQPETPTQPETPSSGDPEQGSAPSEEQTPVVPDEPTEDGSEDVTDPAESGAPVQTPEDEETAAPGDEETTEPGGEETPAPEVTPEETESPEETEAPEETPELDPLTANVSVGVRSGFAGESVPVHLAVVGGGEEISVVYEILFNGAAQSSSDARPVTDGADAWFFTPAALGDYTVAATVTDENGLTATASVTIPVAEHDTTSYDKWVTKAQNVKHTGDWNEDILAVAKSQLGYTESDTDFIVREDGSKQGYTVYGDWYGLDYEEWCAMFVSFCANYAGISSFTHRSLVEDILGDMNYVGVYYERGSEYEPVAGDIIFFDRSGRAGHIGIVSDVSEDTVYTIEGNAGRAVAERKYARDDSEILGYGSMAEFMLRGGLPLWQMALNFWASFISRMAARGSTLTR